MAELESVIEEKLIAELTNGESQWTYRPDIRTEDELWANFKYILEQNNKAALGGMPLSDSEFAKVKNDLSHASFYEAGQWLVGENGKAYVHVHRGDKVLHLLVMNNEHIAGGTSVYEVINQYRVFKSEEDKNGRNRRYDVTLLINGIPMIHIELKNKEHSYINGFNQIKNYISEGKFRGLFSNIQMFVVSNAVDTKYFAAARDTELNKEFLTGWVDEKNKPVCDYLEFTRSVLRIPQAHEMVSKYTVLDNVKKKLLILRPYQIHAIEAMRRASKTGKSGYIWHTTGSGKTMTSYKATRNLLMDIPSIEKTLFLIDRKDLDKQTGDAFKSYSENDTIDVDNTENVNRLIKKLTDGNRQMIVTTIQKMQKMIRDSLKEGEKDYDQIKSLKIAFVVDECHRAVSPRTKSEIERFFANSLWFGFTGTPIFDENRYEQSGDLPQTTEELYGECLHSYTIKEAIHDKAVLGFNIENLGPENIKPEDEEVYYSSENHKRQVLEVILNRSKSKFGMQLVRGKTYEAMLTVDSIASAQEYYDLIMRIKSGQDELKISEEVKKALPDFPKTAITFSIIENEESSKENQEAMKRYLNDYSKMFNSRKSYGLNEITAYNNNLNERLARNNNKYTDRMEQLDLVIVVDRLLTGFDAPCLSTIFIDREPMKPQHLIQAFSRTNRILDSNKLYGQIVTFRSPNEYKKKINDALVLYSKGGFGKAIAEDWDTVLSHFKNSLKAIRRFAPSPNDVQGLSDRQKKAFIILFRELDHNFAHLKSFSTYEADILKEYNFTEEDYEDYAAVYRNMIAELPDRPTKGEGNNEIQDDYELVAYSKFKVDFEYIVSLLQGFVDSMRIEESGIEEFDDKIKELRETVDEFAYTNPKLSNLLSQVIDEIEKDFDKYIDRDISVIINQMRYEAANKEIKKYADKWFLEEEDVSLPKYKFYSELKKDFNERLIPEARPYIS